MSRLSSGRRAVAAASLAALSVGIAGCTSGDPAEPEPSASPSQTQRTSAGPVALRFAAYGEPAQADAYRRLAETFTAQNREVTIDVETVRRVGAATAKLQAELAEGDAPDVFVIERDLLPELVASDQVQPVDALLEERELDFGDGYQRDGLEAFSANAALQCMPNDVTPLVVYYNTALVDLRLLSEEGDNPVTAEDGWTWEQFQLAAENVPGGRGRGVYIAPEVQSLAPFVWSSGGTLVDDNRAPTTLTLSEGASRDAIETVLEVARDARLTPTREQLVRADAVARFEQGRLGMILGTRALTPRLRQARSLDFEVMPLPRLGTYRSVADMSAYCISADTDQVQAAADFLAFAVGEEGATITTRPGYTVPSNTEVANSPVFLSPARPPENSFVFNEAVRRTEPLPFSPQWPAVEESTEPYIERLFYAPVIDLDRLLGEIDRASQATFAPPEESASPTAQSPSG